ncbi:MAG: hypothetical protein AcusKO_19190 [Acuticoccus sp.]
MSVRELTGARELNVDPELVRLIIVKARAALFPVPDAEDDTPLRELEIDAATKVEEDETALLSEEVAADATADEAAAMIDSLNMDEQAEIMALTLIGRGDFEPVELEVAVREAKVRATGPASAWLFAMELFPSHLGDGLDRYEAWAARQAG